MAMIAVMAIFWRGMAPREEEESFRNWEGWKLRLTGAVQLLPVAALIFLVLGSIYLGWAAPSEAAAFGVTGAFFLMVLLNSNELLTPLLGMLAKRTGLVYFLSPNAREKFERLPGPLR